jgi:aspartate/methionine/tyrosine aminotransferase
MRWAEVEPGVIPLTAADPDFPAPPEVIEAIREYIADGYLCYAPKEGMWEFKESISAALKRRKGEDVPPGLILPIDSAARGMYTISRAVLSPGDEVIIFDPVDFLFKESAVAVGGIPVLFPAKMESGRIDLSGLESYVTKKTKMIGLCNPHNPLGTLYSKEDLEKILDIAEKYGLYIMNDEIWSDIVYPGKDFLSILSFGKERNKRTGFRIWFFQKFWGGGAADWLRILPGRTFLPENI